MRKMAVIALSLSLMLTLFGCGTQKTPLENPKPSDEVQTSADAQSPAVSATKNGETKISIAPPAGWEPVVGSVLPVQYMKNTASFMVKQENFSGKTVDDVVMGAKKIFERSFKEVVYADEAEAITVDGFDARKLVFTCTVSKLQMKYEYIYLFVGENVYAITFGDLANTFDSLAADYEQILKDLRFE